MSLFKFNDSNFLNKSNHPEIVATIDTYNGNQFKLVNDAAVPFDTDEEVKAGNGYFMFNIIDKPEILNTNDYKVKTGESIRSWCLMDFADEKFDISADLVSDGYDDIVKGDKLVGRCNADKSDVMSWKKVSDVTGYSVYLEVIKKTTFGAFTIDKNGGDVAGGYVVKVKVVDQKAIA